MSKRHIIVTGKPRSEVDLDLLAQAFLALLDEQLRLDEGAAVDPAPPSAEQAFGAGGAA